MHRRVTGLPNVGVQSVTLTLNGVPVSAGADIATSAISGGLLRYAPPANANGTTYAQFGFKVQDTGGTANNGLDTDPTAKTITVNVTAVPDNPLLRYNFAVFLHDHHPRTAHPPKPTGMA